MSCQTNHFLTVRRVDESRKLALAKRPRFLKRHSVISEGFSSDVKHENIYPQNRAITAELRAVFSWLRFEIKAADIK